MAFLRTLFWIVLTVVVVVFSLRNWVPVTVNLFGDLQADVKLPVLLLIAFLAGFLPVYAWHRATRWRAERRQVSYVPPPATAGVAPLAQPPAPGIAPAEAD